MKKIFNLFLVLCLFVPVLALTGCGSKPKEWEIVEKEWKETISTENFYISTQEYDKVANNKPIRISYKHYKNDDYKNIIDYTVVFKNSYSQKGMYESRYAKKIDEQGNVIGYYAVDTDAGIYVFSSDLDEITETEYNRHIGAYISLIDYIGNNYSKFSTTDEVPENLDLPTSYTCDVADMNNQQASIAPLGISQLFVAKKDGVSAYFVDSNNVNWELSFKPTIEKIYNKLNTYYIKGGPSRYDVDYGEYYFDGENGFRMYTPNNTIENRQEAYYKKNEDGKTYTKYVKQTSTGAWSASKTTADDFNTMVSTTKDLYLPFMTEFHNFKVVEDNGLNSVYTLNTNDGSYSKDNGNYTYKYYDVKVVVSNNKITSITWKMKFSLNNISSAVYNMELGYMSEGLTYPIV